MTPIALKNRETQEHRNAFWGPGCKARIAKHLKFIRHWKIYNCSYEECPVTAPSTWFIDPPYKNPPGTQTGTVYTFGSSKIDYEHLSQWCRTRPGQVIVCEEAQADWLPFRPLWSGGGSHSNKRKRTEGIWTNDDPR